MHGWTRASGKIPTKKEVYGMWKRHRPLGRNMGTLSEYEGMRREGLRPVWNQGQKKGFFKYISRKRDTRENMGLLLS